MPYVIDVTIEDNGPKRAGLRPAHLEYLEANLGILLAAGAKLSDGGEPLGALYIVDCETRAEAEAFMAAEPYFRNGLCGSVTYSSWRKAYFDHRKQVQPGAR